MFLDTELYNVDKAHKDYAIVKRRTDYMQIRAKRRARLLLGKPAVLLSIFAVGAFKGATTSNPKAKRKIAFMSFARTVFFQLIS